MTPKANPPYLIIIFLLLFTIYTPPHVFSYSEAISKKSLRVTQLKKKFNIINNELKDEYEKEIIRIEKDYYLQINRLKAQSPDPPAPRDMFETQHEYNKRIADYKKALNRTERLKKKQLREFNEAFNLRFKTSSVEVDILKKRIDKLTPIVTELKRLQNETHIVSGDPVYITLFRPEPDKFRFPIHFIQGTRKWTDYWPYSDREKARQLWKYKSHIKADILVQLEQRGDTITYTHTAFKVYNSVTKESRIFRIGNPVVFSEIDVYNQIRDEDLPAAELMVALKNVVHGPVEGMDFIFISPRSFMMGSPRTEAGRWSNETRHKVTLTKGFYMQITEVTQGQWRAVMGNNPSENSGCGSDCPVENVYWGDVMEFIHRLNKLEKTNQYRLPTEAEWEYACRAGNTALGAHHSDESRLGEYAWFKDNSNGTPHPVATKKPNNWGLFDMHGNVSEWCSDWFGPYPNHPVTDPAGPFSGKFRVGRGGNWFFPARSCRAADRNSNLPGDRCGYLGFRVVKSP